MKKVIYLNYDLSKPEDFMCYNFLLNLGRTKKSFVNTVLLSTHLPQNYAVSMGLTNLSKEQEISRTVEVTVHKNMVQTESKEEVQATESPPKDSRKAEWMEEETAEDTALKILEEENPYPMFTTEQLKRIWEKGLDLDALTMGQKKAMAKMMEDYVPAATAYSLAGFEE